MNGHRTCEEISSLMDKEFSNGDGYGDGGKELLEAQAHIWNQIFNFINSMSLKCAIELGIPDIIHTHPHKPITLSELVNALQVPKEKSPYLFRLMRKLVHSGFFAMQNVLQPETEEAEGYVLTPSSKLLLKGHSKGVSSLVSILLHPDLVTPWNFMSHWFQRDHDLIPPFEITSGISFWEYCGKNPDGGKLFDEAMACDARLVMSVVLKECKEKFEGLTSLVDVGGGVGTVARAVAEDFPSIRCIVLELPHVIGTLEGSKNLEFVNGDMFESIPSAQAVLLKWIMHDWSDDECVNILKRCREAIPSKEEGGKVIIIDMVVDEKNKRNYQSQLFFDMLMMVVLHGRERTELEWEKLFLDAGFTSYHITPILGVRSFIEVFP